VKQEPQKGKNGVEQVVYVLDEPTICGFNDRSRRGQRRSCGCGKRRRKRAQSCGL